MGNLLNECVKLAVCTAVAVVSISVCQEIILAIREERAQKRKDKCRQKNGQCITICMDDSCRHNRGGCCSLPLEQQRFKCTTAHRSDNKTTDKEEKQDGINGRED